MFLAKLGNHFLAYGPQAFPAHLFCSSLEVRWERHCSGWKPSMVSGNDEQPSPSLKLGQPCKPCTKTANLHAHCCLYALHWHCCRNTYCHNITLQATPHSCATVINRIPSLLHGELFIEKWLYSYYMGSLIEIATLFTNCCFTYDSYQFQITR